MAELTGYISSVYIEPGAVVTLKDQYPEANKYTMEVTQSGATQSLTWQDGKLAIDDTVIGTDTTWSSAKISTLESPAEVNIGTVTPTEEEKIWVDLNGSDPDEYCIRFDIAQTLTEAEKLRVRTTIGVSDAEKEVTVSATEPTSPRTILWINTNGSDPDEYCVRYDISQTLTAEEQKRARVNIGADYEARIAALEAKIVELETKLGINNF